MFYSNSDDYMQDLYFYNQNPNNNYMNMNPIQNSMVNNPQNCMMNNQGFMPNMMQGTCIPNMYQNNTNINSLYPSIYKIIWPVVSKVLTNSNFRILNEEALDNMVETVYNIVDGDILYEDKAEVKIENKTVSNINSSSSTNTSKNAEISRISTNSQNATTRNDIGDNLLKDIIKILILKEILFRRNQSGQFPRNYDINIMY